MASRVSIGRNQPRMETRCTVETLVVASRPQWLVASHRPAYRMHRHQVLQQYNAGLGMQFYRNRVLL